MDDHATHGFNIVLANKISVSQACKVNELRGIWISNLSKSFYVETLQGRVLLLYILGGLFDLTAGADVIREKRRGTKGS